MEEPATDKLPPGLAALATEQFEMNEQVIGVGQCLRLACNLIGKTPATYHNHHWKMLVGAR